MGKQQAAILATAMLLAAAPPALAQSFTNASVIALHKAGLGDSVIAAKIADQPCGYNVGTEALIELKHAGLSDALITAMVMRCSGAPATSPRPATSPAPAVPLPAATAPAPGIYLADGATPHPHLTLLRPAAQASTKLTGNGSILFPHMARLIVPQPAAQVASTTARPVFYFYFTPEGRHVGGFGEVNTEAAQSPAEFSLVHFRRDGGNRQVPIGRTEPYVEITGIDPKNTLPFTVEDLGWGTFKVVAGQDLAPGEYGFVLVGERDRRRSPLFRIYDFTVTAPAPQ